ncbi:hypothetical protein B296_00028142 [Ensete ventricosum]|uniref:Uncharacterized protein n=1 Tax=Ensete ventricosum TaxID=4639 RepID=A0A426Z406_ENSVE|nr:hypothetical protein B296_00028142 [Ensete ventricosum]
MIGATRELDYFSVYIRLRKPDKSDDKIESCMRVAVCLSIDHAELPREHRSVEAGGQKGRGSDDKSSGAQLPTNKASVRKKMNSEECHSAAEADLPMARKRHGCEATDSKVMSLVMPWYHRGGTSVEASIPCSHGGKVLVVKGAEKVENVEANSKYQDRA